MRLNAWSWTKGYNIPPVAQGIYRRDYILLIVKSKGMEKVKIIGVPEHFNLPWHLALEEDAFQDRGIDLQWRDVPQGSGRMCQLLQEGKADLGIVLTEGALRSISQGNPCKIVQQFIASPLLWGIHVSGNSDKGSLEALERARVAISRMGSGSHLMAYIHAQQRGWDPGSLEFDLIDDLDGAVAHLASGADAYFMWEHFTTKPLVDNGTFKRLGDCPTPWPCFVVVATDAFIAKRPGVLKHILEIINSYTLEFKDIPSIDRTLSNRYGQQLADVRAWLAATQWGQSQLDRQTVGEVQEKLLGLHLIEGIKDPDLFLWP